MYQKKGYDKIREKVEDQVYEYFDKIQIPEFPTIYDLLLLSLRKKDLVATFNWDPLIVQAYRRNGNKFDLPNLLFLHGNVEAGFCESDVQNGLKGFPCNTCGKPLEKTPLLYPITEKNYDSNGFLNSQWKTLQKYIKSAFWITFFGYSAPESDTRAINLIKSAWGEVKDRNMEQIEIINIEPEEELRKSELWEPFIHSHHYDIWKHFFKSWMANHPRRTGEAYHNQFKANRFIHET